MCVQEVICVCVCVQVCISELQKSRPRSSHAEAADLAAKEAEAKLAANEAAAVGGVGGVRVCVFVCVRVPFVRVCVRVPFMRVCVRHVRVCV